jgi:hypothetical protein
VVLVPIPDDPAERAVYEAILADVRAAAAGATDQSIRKIASRYAVSTRKVRTIAQENGLRDAWSSRTEHTAAATQARMAELAARRLEIADRFLEEAEELLDRIHEPHLAFSFGGKENVYNEQLLPTPPSPDVRNYMQAAALAFDRHLAAVKHDTHDAPDVGASLTGQLADGFQRAYDAMVAAEQSEVVVDGDADHPER